MNLIDGSNSSFVNDFNNLFPIAKLQSTFRLINKRFQLDGNKQIKTKSYIANIMRCADSGFEIDKSNFSEKIDYSQAITDECKINILENMFGCYDLPVNLIVICIYWVFVWCFCCCWCYCNR